MPVSICYLGNNGDEEWECEILVTLENGQEIIIFEEAHSSISNL